MTVLLVGNLMHCKVFECAGKIEGLAVKCEYCPSYLILYTLRRERNKPVVTGKNAKIYITLNGKH